jgi:hypothetical protein
MHCQQRLSAAIAAIAAFLLFTACTPSTTVEQSWTAPTASVQGPIQRAVTLFVSDGVVIRRAAEDEMAGELIKRGIQATPGYSILGDVRMSDLNAVKGKLKSMGYDGVVVMRIVDREQELEYMPSTFDMYWGYAYPGFYGNGYAYTAEIYRIETSVYSLKTGQLVYSGLTRTWDPDSAAELIDSTSKVIAGELTKRGLSAYGEG